MTGRSIVATPARSIRNRLRPPLRAAAGRGRATAKRVVRNLPHPVRRRLLDGRRAVRDGVDRVLDSGAVAGITSLALWLRPGTAATPIERLDADGPQRLDAAVRWFRVRVQPDTRYLLTIETAEQLDADARAAIVRYRYLDRLGRRLPTAGAAAVDHGKASSRKLGAHDWIPRVPQQQASRYVVFAPARATNIDIGLATTGAGPVTIAAARVEPLGPRRTIDRYDVPTGLEPRSPLRIALVADTFTATALRLEAHVVALSADGWRDELRDFRPDLLLVESAWNGNDGQWRYRIANLKPDDVGLRELVADARSLGIAVLFWNKEDPAHYDDFLAAARLCDHVATTDADVIDRYRADLGHERVWALPFCIQPDIHNPRQPGDASGERLPVAAFLGSWWAAKFDARRRAQAALLEGATDYGLEIFDRYLTWDDHERYRFAPEWLPYVHGTLDYDQALSAYRRYGVVLNVNTVTDSATMFSRRALEASACGAAVVTNPSAGTDAALGDLVVSAATAEEARKALAELAASPGERDLLAHRAYRHTHRHHAWANRLDDVAGNLGIALATRARPRISVVLATKRRAGADRIIRYLAGLTDDTVEIEPIVVTAFDPDDLEAQEEIQRSGAIVLQERPGETLGDCLNRGAEAATGGFIAKVDDDDLYGPNYFGDLHLALDHSRADIAGKHSHYTHFEVNDSTVIRYPGREHRFTEFVCGSTLLCRADVYDEIRFPSRRVGEDTEFLRRATEAGLRIYSADRFSYVSMRRTDLDSHTWQEDHETLLGGNTTREWCTGLPHDHLSA